MSSWLELWEVGLNRIYDDEDIKEKGYDDWDFRLFWRMFTCSWSACGLSLSSQIVTPADG